MSWFVPRSLSDYKDESLRLGAFRALVRGDLALTVLVVGPAGSGKHTMMDCVLNDRFGPNAHCRLASSCSAHDGSQFEFRASRFHYEADASNMSCAQVLGFLNLLSARTLLPSKELAILYGAESLSRATQMMMRGILEHLPLDFVLVATSCQGIIPALRSRCVRATLGAKRGERMLQFAQSMLARRGADIPQQALVDIVQRADGNMKHLLLLCEQHLARVPLDDVGLKHFRVCTNIMAHWRPQNHRALRNALVALSQQWPVAFICRQLARHYDSHEAAQCIARVEHLFARGGCEDPAVFLEYLAISLSENHGPPNQAGPRA